MLCTRCHKNPAVIYITWVENGRSRSDNVCISCAKELGVKQVDEIVDKLGISDEDVKAMNERFSELLGKSPEELTENMDDNGMQYLKSILSGEDFGKQEEGPSSDEEGMVPSEDGGEGDIMELETDNSAPFGMPKKGGSTSRVREKDKKPPKRKFLDAYATNLNHKAKRGEIDRIIGRDKELERMIAILCRRVKNNPCLIGEPGVGKTAIAEALAVRLANNDVPAKLLGKELYLLSLTSLVAGTQFRGQFESRVKGLIDDIKKSGNVILMIDEVHNIVASGDAEGGAMNAANILKPALSRGEIQVIGATTFNEYRKYIEKDAALERRFQPVNVAEPSIEDATEMLKGTKEYYENYHNVVIDDEIVRQAVILSERYITDRYLPDKAIDLIDEASVNASLSDKISAQIALDSRELAELRRQEEEMMQETDSTIFEKRAKLKAEECRILDHLAQLNTQRNEVKVTVEDLAYVIGLWTGIPATKIKDEEGARLTKLHERLATKIIGQDEAIDSIARAIIRNRVGVSSKRKPISFIFVGPTGVGKTELAKVLAADLFDVPEALIRFDMSEFMEKHAVSRIIGAPPGYIGYDEAGQLTEKIRRRPYSVILFDEIEKAHPDVLNILLQILDDGHITDSKGRKVNFENTVIIMTSNAGTEKGHNVLGFNRQLSGQDKENVADTLLSFLRPEFLNRVDEVISFRKLTQEDFVRIVDIMLTELTDNMKEKHISLSFDEGCKRILVKKAYSEKYGARNLRRTIQKEVEDEIASLIVANRDKGLKEIDFIAKDGEIMKIAL